MTQPLEDYYERELAFLQDIVPLMARRYPKEAGALPLRKDLPADPHLQRFIEAFAFLAGRVHHKIDSDLSELTESLSQVLYPHLLRIIPSGSTAQLAYHADAKEQASTGSSHAGSSHTGAPGGAYIERGTTLTSRPLGSPGLACQYRTGYPVTLWPIRLTSAQLQPPPFTFPGVQSPPRSQGVLRLQFECNEGLRFADLGLDRLRLYLNGSSQFVALLYEVLFNHATRIAFRSLDKKQPPLVFEPNSTLFPVGFERDEDILPYPPESFEGNRLLEEFLYYPEKFHYLDLAGWDRVRDVDLGSKVEVLIFVNRSHANLEQGINAETFLLGCTPIVNVFRRGAEPVPVSHTQTEYYVLPARGHRDGMEIYSIDSVLGVDGSGRPTREFQPIFTFHPDESADQLPPSFACRRRPSSSEQFDPGTEMYLTIIDPEFHPTQQADMVLNVQTTCTNRELPTKFQRAGDPLMLPPHLRASISARCLYTPSPPLRPRMQRSAHWRLLSQNALNYLSLTHAEESRDVLREMIRVCDFTQPGTAKHNTLVQILEGIMAVQTRRVTGWLQDGNTIGTCRGIEVTVSFDETKYVGVGVYLFASVLERFFALAARINGFSQLIAKAHTSEGVIKRWPARAMDRLLHAQARGCAGPRQPAHFGAGQLQPPVKRASAPEISPRSQTPTTSEEFNVAKLPRASLARQLFEEPYQFDFFQAVRLLEKLIPRRVMLGGAGPIQREVVRLRARQSLDFPPSSVHELLPPGAASPLPLMTISFFGMTGPMGVLPRHYTELLMRQEREYRGPERYVFRDWLDQFNHRMASFFYRAWVKYRLFVPFERGEYARQDPDDFTRALLSIVGLGTPRLRDRLRITQRPAVTSDVAEPAGADLGEADDPEKVLAQVNDLALFRFGGLLCRQPRNAVSLEAILHGFFRLPVEIRQHQGQWLRLEPGSQSMLGKQRLNNAMGRNVVVGDRVWDVQSKIRVRLGPLDYDQFLEFLPDRTPVARRKRIYLLAHVVRLYVGMEVDAEVQLVLKSSEVPSCQLGAKKGFGSRLGWNTWARRKRMRRDGDEPVFPAEDRRHV